MSRCSGFRTCVRSPKTPIVVGLLRDLLGVLATAGGAVSWAWSAAAASAAAVSAAAVSAAAVSATAVSAAVVSAAAVSAVAVSAAAMTAAAVLPLQCLPPQCLPLQCLPPQCLPPQCLPGRSICRRSDCRRSVCRCSVYRRSVCRRSICCLPDRSRPRPSLVRVGRPRRRAAALWWMGARPPREGARARPQGGAPSRDVWWSYTSPPCLPDRSRPRPSRVRVGRPRRRGASLCCCSRDAQSPACDAQRPWAREP